MDDIKLERTEWAPVVGEAKAVEEGEEEEEEKKKKKKTCFNHKASEEDHINAPKVYSCYLES